MSEKTSMFELLKERLTEEEIIKITCDYDLKFCKLEEENKELKQKIKYYENFEINKTKDKNRLENNKREKDLQNQLQQKENIIKEVREYCLEKAKGRLERTLYDDILEILNKENE